MPYERIDKRVEQLAFTPGQLLVFSSGQYSDYHIYGVFCVEKAFDTTLYLEIQGTLEAEAKAQGSLYWQRSPFTYLIQEGYLQRLAVPEVFLGDYGQNVFCLKKDD